MDVATEHGWKLVDEERLQSKVNLYWIDVALIHERFRTILPWQCINHFPGMPNIARKNRMGQNLNRMQKLFPKEYSFYPRTWVLPGELADFRQQFDNNGVALNNKIFIIKPDAGCQGRGIFLTRTLDTVPVSENVVAQVYIKKPLLLDGFKFDLRIYVIVTSVKPLRMYLFHDGLVRMCTEEYVKPTKQNLGMMCMHLTNYAVNKHNENFQQPSASTSEECQDEGSKRSLLWFMNWVRKERGDAKADWLWKRIGVLCTRTLLCIMPTLSREYDQHFKSFAGIPVDMSKIQSPHREGGTVPVKPPTTQGATGSGTVRGRPGRTNLSSSAAEGSKDGSEDEEGNEDDDGAAATQQQQQASAAETTDGGKSASPTNAPPPPDDGLPKIRGSRCFEVLGFDIMMDHNLNPWLIEVNHLPSFGTDSPLDRDIKDRLMRQVFSVLPTRGDDYAAYVAHQKVESEKRLISQTKERQAKLEAARQAQQKPLPKAAPRPRPTQSNPNAAHGAHGSNGGNATNENNNNSEDDRSENTGNIAEESQQEDENLCTPERLEEIKKVLLDVYDKHSPEKINKIDRLMGKYIGHEEEFLLFVFAKYGVSPTEYESEVRRQQRLERIRRYREQQQQQQAQQQPQQSSSSMAPSNEDGSTADPSSDAGGDGSGGETTHDPDDGGQDEENSGHNQLISGSQDTSSLPSTGIASAGGNGSNSNNNNKAREPNKRYSRSLSPPRSGNNTNNSVASTSTTRGRPVPAWKVGGADEEAQLREEILAMHVPSEDEEWLRFEMARLGQCTRIFPPEPRRANAANDAEDGKEEQEDVDDADETTQANAMAMANGEDSAKLTPSASATSQPPAAAAAKSATYEEILFHVFLQDRRQTMRLRCPLPNRDPNNVNKDGFLPPLDGPSSSRASFSSMGSGRGVVGWKAPRSNQPIDPKAAANKQPTQQQLEFAKRLSQGLSVSSKSTQNPKRFVRSVGPQSVVTMTTDPSIQYSVVLDPQEYVTNGGVGGTGSQASLMGVGSASGGTMAMPQQAAVYANGQEIIWPSTKAHRLYEESRNNRMRIEAARANNGAILRQQVFYFDPNYESYQPALVMGMPPMSDGSTVMAPTSVVVAGGSVVNGGGGGGGGGAERRPSVASEAMMMHQGSSGHQQMLLLQQQQLQQQQQAWKGVGVGARPGVASGGRPANGIVTQVAPGSTGSLMSTNGQTIINGSKPPGMHGGNGSGGGTGNGTGNGVAQQGSKGMYAGGAQPSMGRGNGLPASMQQQQQQQQQAAMAGGNATKQEELLRQLFPSWF
eukprot:gene12064-8619_t